MTIRECIHHRSLAFYLLYDKICREDILVHAYRLARINAGAPGVEDARDSAMISSVVIEHRIAPS